MNKWHYAWGAALAAPFAFLLLPEHVSNAINGTLALVALVVAVLAFMLTGIIRLGHWWQGRTERVRAVQDTLDAMGYANTRNAKQQIGGHHGRP